MICETVKIVSSNEQGFVIINKEDFKDGEHKLFDENKKSSKREQSSNKGK